MILESGSELSKRIITAVTLASAITFLLFFAGAFFLSFLLLTLTFFLATEWSEFASVRDKYAKIGYAVLVVAIALAMAFSLDYLDIHTPLVISALIIWAALSGMLIWHEMIGSKKRLSCLLRGIFGVFILSLFFVSTSIIYMENPLFLFLLLVTVWTVDISAYFVGKYFGGRKFAPTISPNKTWSGVFGGLLGGTIIFLVLHYFAINLTGASGVLCGMLISIVCVFGDLLESEMKRAVDLKDSGAVLPGHGGLLDRLDSVIAAAPFYCFMIISGYFV